MLVAPKVIRGFLSMYHLSRHFQQTIRCILLYIRDPVLPVLH